MATERAARAGTVRLLDGDASGEGPTIGSACPAGVVVRRTDQLRLRGAALAQVHGEARHRPDSEHLRLPVLERSVPEVCLAEVAEEAHRVLPLAELLAVVRGPAGDRGRRPG